MNRLLAIAPECPKYSDDLHPDPDVRRGSEAVPLAELACPAPECRDAGLLDTLAAAYAEVGRFSDAISTQHKALALASQRGAKAEVSSYRERLALYQQGKAFHEAPPG